MTKSPFNELKHKTWFLFSESKHTAHPVYPDLQTNDSVPFGESKLSLYPS